MGVWATGAPLLIIWHYYHIGVLLFFIEHCREERHPVGLALHSLPNLNGLAFTQRQEYLNPPTILEHLYPAILKLIPRPQQTIRAHFQDACWGPFDPPQNWVNPAPSMAPVRWYPTILHTTGRFDGLSDHLQMLALYNNPRHIPRWNTWIEWFGNHRKQSIRWKDKREFVTHPRHAFQPSKALQPIPLPDKEDTVVHFWVERVDGQGFAEVSAAHIPDFMARGFVGYRHKLCRQLVCFYLPGSFDPAQEANSADPLQLLLYTEDLTPMHLDVDLAKIPCDPPTMESQMPGVHSMERLEHEGQILISGRMADAVGGGAGYEAEEGEVGGFDDQSPANHTHTPRASGPIRATQSIAVAPRNTGPLPRKQQRGKHKPWDKRDGPSDQRYRLWGHWKKLTDFFTSHQDLLQDLEPPPATAPGKHSNAPKPNWEGLLGVAEDLSVWICRNRCTAQWIALQHSSDPDRANLWLAVLKRLEYKKVWLTDMPHENEPVHGEWVRAKERWLSS